MCILYVLNLCSFWLSLKQDLFIGLLARQTCLQSASLFIEVYKPCMWTQQTRVRKFCVDIAPSFIARNIDAALLREHSVRRVCAHYNYCNFCVISPFASTYASVLRKKPFLQKMGRVRKKNYVKKNSWPGFEPAISCSLGRHGRMISRRKPTGLHRSKDNWPNSHFFMNRQHVETVGDILTNFYNVKKSKLFYCFWQLEEKFHRKGRMPQFVMLLPFLFAILGVG